MQLDVDAVAAARDERFRGCRAECEMAADPDGIIRLHGERFNIMGADYFMADIYHMLRDLYGDGAGGILYQTGLEYGQDLRALVDGREGQAVFGEVLGLIAYLGYSLPTVEHDRVVVPSSPTAVEYAKSDYDQRRVCYFLAGMLAGGVRAVAPDADVQETACQADGDDNCVFVIEDG